jgi:hypothetical protein
MYYDEQARWNPALLKAAQIFCPQSSDEKVFACGLAR